MKPIILFSIALISLAFFLVGSGCANPIPPSGGPRDTIPPVLLSISPGDSSTLFQEKAITLTFDEFVEIQNPSEIMVSPSPASPPEINRRLRTVTIRLRDSLEQNTTYTIDFGNAIRDINEGNPLQNFTYIFSTGPFIDSLTFRGRVLLAETGKTDTNMIVMLHRNLNDSAVVNDRPRYVTKLDGKGSFLFRNLPQGTFAVYALRDEGGSRRYMNTTQLFAFADSPVVIGPATRPITLYAYSDPNRTSNLPGRNAPRSSNDRRLRFTTNIQNNQQDLMDRLVVNFEAPLKMLDTTRIRLAMDSTYTPANFTIQRDTSNRSFSINTQWKENTTYHLILDKDFAEDSTGRRLLRSDTVVFLTRRLADYGSVRIRFRNVDFTLHPVLQFVQQDQVVRSLPLNLPEIFIPQSLPGEFELRILYDRNNNGKWDPGEFFNVHRQPEIVRPIERRISVKPAWENEFEIVL